MNTLNQATRQRGFTLIELMIVVAIVGILSAIAYPSYTEYVRKGRRVEGRTTLLQAAQYLERAATATGKYPTSLPSQFSESPGGFYQITLDSDGTDYSLTATPNGTHTDPSCGNLGLTRQGEQTPASPAICWNK